MALAPADRAKLAGVLALLGSPHHGERDAAALAADRLVRGRGLDWRDVLGAIPAAAPAAAHSPAVGHLADLMTCRRRLDLLTPWEKTFVAGLVDRRKISDRQRDILTKLAAKVRAA